MATDRTRALTAPLTSMQMRVRVNPIISTTERRQILQTRPGAREVRSAYSSADGRALYAHDGISVRRVK